MDAKHQSREASFGLFARRGIRGVGVDELIAASGVAKATFYKHFCSKDDLALAYLDGLYEQRRTAIEDAARARGPGPDSLAAVFDALAPPSGNTLRPRTSFVHLLIESGPGTPLGLACADYAALFRRAFARKAAESGLQDPEEFAQDLQFILKASLVSAVEGEPDGLGRGRRMALRLIAHHLPD